MKPGSSRNVSSTRNVERKKENMKNTRKSLHVLQPAAGPKDKENLIGPGRNMVPSEKDSLKLKKEENEKTQSIVKKKKVSNKGVQTDSEKVQVTADDLTSDEPSEKYWQVLAEKRRVALEEALQENETLCEKISILEQEKAVTQAMLEETKALVETFKEIIAETEDNEQRDE